MKKSIHIYLCRLGQDILRTPPNKLLIPRSAEPPTMEGIGENIGTGHISGKYIANEYMY
jgi:hypothetical protein